ncbi:MAG: tRNA preQ1(34) S-adenosylmethionine ribosyltransferase-isomerase QueA [Patescibacteria group bacterium]
MTTKTSEFDYLLPPELIAQEPSRPRDNSRLLVLNRKTGNIEHRRFFELGEYLRPGDLLVVNQSKVFKARLSATMGAELPDTGRGNRAPTKIEIFLIRPEGDSWIALAKPGKKLKVNSKIIFADGTVAEVMGKKEDGTVLIKFQKTFEEIISWADRVGQVPVPPYVKHVPEQESDYQTVYAKTVGSVAAPTAGFHFTKELIEKLKSQDVNFAYLTLHVGLGTFRPIKTENLEEHKMHEEWIEVPKETIQAIKETKKRGGRVIAVGTTSVRALESAVRLGDENGYTGFTSLFITPGFEFKIVDSMITNFHLPRSSLLVLVSSFANKDLILKAYSQAVQLGYRFYSFGDAMLIK